MQPIILGQLLQLLDAQGAVLGTSSNLQGQRLPVDPVVILEALEGKASSATLPTAEGQRVRPARQKAGRKQPRRVARLHRPVRDAPGRRFHLDERLEPVKAPRPVADQLNVRPPTGGLLGDRPSDLLGAKRDGARVARNEDPGHQRFSQSDTSRSKRSGVTRPYRWPSIITAGDRAQLPRQ